ncbi:MAG: transposase [Anaerolineae bacterium]|nr:transposase [Anaerolineae bacterium]
MSDFQLGIDVSKKSFDVMLLGGRQPYGGHFGNDATGWGKLRRWLQKRQAETVHACLEATGRYWVELALFLHTEGHAVSVVNPKLIKKHGEATMQRNKTDAQDALTIADYCRKQQPDLWEPPAVAYRELQAMVRHVQALKVDRTRAMNRRQSGVTSSPVLAAVEAQIAFLAAQIKVLEKQINDHIDQHPKLKADKELLTSIPGIGDTTAAVFLAEVPHVRSFAQADQVAAFAGLTPGQRQSGTSLHSPGKLVKWGNARIRAAFYMPALSAHNHNPILASLRQRLLRRGKTKMTVIVAVMRKMVHLCYGVLKTRQPFDPNYAQVA